MIIDKALFGECFCPASGIGRVCLRGDRDIPEELEEAAKTIDKESEYSPSCFCVEIFDGGALVYYSGTHLFKKLCVCDNYNEVLNYYKKHASKEDIKETFNNWK